MACIFERQSERLTCWSIPLKDARREPTSDLSFQAQCAYWRLAWGPEMGERYLVLTNLGLRITN